MNLLKKSLIKYLRNKTLLTSSTILRHILQRATVLQIYLVLGKLIT